MSRIPVPLFVVLLAACGGDGDDPVVAGGGTASLLAPVDAPVESGGDGGNASRDDVVVSGNDRTTFRDEETGSVWTLTGLAIDGPLAGAQLQQLPAYSAYWFAWSSFWPNTDVWGQQDGSGEYAESAFQPIESGFVPDVPIDAIPPLDDPFAGFGWALFEPAEDSGLRDADIVVGVEVDGDARAYPVQILNFHEIVNHTVGDRELIVTYCPLTASGIAFEGGETFGNTGGLFNNNMVMYDRTSRSFWSQMGLSVIRGDRADDRLTLYPVFQGTWHAWRELFPHTTVLSAETGYSRNYDRDIYIVSGYTESREIWFSQSASIDPRFHPKAMTLGLIGASGSRAYVFERLSTIGDHAVINDDFEGQPVVIAFDEPARMAVPFSRVVADRTLTFSVIR